MKLLLAMALLMCGTLTASEKVQFTEKSVVDALKLNITSLDKMVMKFGEIKLIDYKLDKDGTIKAKVKYSLIWTVDKEELDKLRTKHLSELELKLCKITDALGKKPVKGAIYKEFVCDLVFEKFTKSWQMKSKIGSYNLGNEDKGDNEKKK